MTGLLTAGPAYFPGWVSIVFSLGLALGIVHHLPCLIRRHGNRWFHAAHAAMALSMIYMYLSMSYDWNWLPATWQMWFFVATSAAITGWLLAKVLRRQPVNFLWVPLLVQQAAMAYMWYPMMRWNAIVIFALVSWFAIEGFGWAANLLPDDARKAQNNNWFSYQLGAHQLGTHLIASGWKDRTLMAIMALSMGYMFYGMQLLR